MQSKQSLVDQAIEQMKMDISAGDWTAIEELLMLVPEENLSGFCLTTQLTKGNIMGLDMYLRAKKYLRSYNDEDLSTINAIADLDIKGTAGMEPKEVSFSAMYWRKANHIHGWFVDNVQDGEDDCRPYEVSIEQLHELLALCKQVLEDRGSAPDLLPSRTGFFFGSDEYDDWYYDSLQETVNRFGQILSADGVDYLDFEYQASW